MSLAELCPGSDCPNPGVSQEHLHCRTKATLPGGFWSQLVWIRRRSPSPVPGLQAVAVPTPPVCKEGAHLARQFWGESRGYPDIPSTQGAGGRRSPKPPRELSCGEGTQAAHEPHGGRASIPLRNSPTRRRSGGGCDRAVSPPESEHRPHQAQSWGGGPWSPRAGNRWLEAAC